VKNPHGVFLLSICNDPKRCCVILTDESFVSKRLVGWMVNY
jgi:hypothetical protein